MSAPRTLRTITAERLSRCALLCDVLDEHLMEAGYVLIYRMMITLSLV